MTKNNFLQPALIGLANLQVILNQKGGPGEDGHLFEEILGIQDSILQKFGLPINPDHEKLLWFSSVPSVHELSDRITRLEGAATNYLLSNAKSDLQILREAQETNQDVMYALPEINIPTHTYTIFVYNKILLKHKDDLENILSELKLVANTPDILDSIGRIEQGIMENEHEVVEDLVKMGVRYLQQFYMHNSDLLGDDDY